MRARASAHKVAVAVRGRVLRRLGALARGLDACAARSSTFSDGTGITAETIGHSVLTQFENVDFETFRIPFVDDEAKARSAALRIKTLYAQCGVRPIVVNTIMDQKLSDVVAESGAFMLDVFAPFLGPLEIELDARRSPRVGKAHGLTISASTRRASTRPTMRSRTTTAST